MQLPSRTRVYLVLSLLLAFTFVAATAERAVTGTTSDASTTGPQKWAVVIGVGDYSDPGIGDLPNAVNDARAIKNMLVTMPDGFPEQNVILLADTEGPQRTPTRANMMRFLKSQLMLVGSDDTLLVYFAGHGATEAGRLYLLPKDASLSEVEFTGFPFADVQKHVETAAAQKKILILDACHSGAGRAADRLDAAAITELERASEGMVTLASCSAEELSHEMPDANHGAFTYFLLQGLAGEADRDSNGYVSASELSLHTWDATRRWAATQGLTQTPWRMEKVAGEIILSKAGADVAAALSATSGSIPTSTPTATQTYAPPPQRGTDPRALVGRWNGRLCHISPKFSIGHNGNQLSTSGLFSNEGSLLYQPTEVNLVDYILELRTRWSFSTVSYRRSGEYKMELMLSEDGSHLYGDCANTDSKQPTQHYPVWYSRAGSQATTDQLAARLAQPIHAAAFANDLPRLERLLSEGASPDAVDGVGDTPIIYAARQGHHQIIKKLLANESDPQKVGPLGYTPLHWAAWTGSIEATAALIEAVDDVDIAKQGRTEWTPIQLAVRGGQLETTAALAKAGANLEALNPNGFTLLISAAGLYDVRMLKMLAEHGADISTKDDGGKAVLWHLKLLKSSKYIDADSRAKASEMYDYLKQHGRKKR